MVDRVSHFLVNVPEPELVTTNIYVVAGSAIRLSASGLTGDEFVQIQIFVGDGNASNGNWEDLYRCDKPIRLTATNTQHMEVVGGKYRVVYEGVASVKVWAETNDLNLDKNVIYAFTNPCCPPSGGGGGITVLDTPSVDLTLAGTVLSADCKISADVGNIISIHADGLYATGGGGSITVSDTNSIDLTLALGNLTADSKISASVGNIISINPDGLFATAGGGAFNMAFTDQGAAFSLAATYHAYRVADAAVGDIDVTFPAPATNTGQIYIIEQRSDDAGTHDAILKHGAVQINGAMSDVTLPVGMVCLAYSTGANYNICNFLQLAPAQSGEAGPVANILTWIPGPYGTGGAYVPAQDPYIAPNYTAGYDIVAGMTTTISHTDEITITAVGDSNLAAATVNLPALVSTVQISLLNIGGGANNITVHPAGTDKINGVNADYALLPGKAIILISLLVGPNIGWWIVGGV